MTSKEVERYIEHMSPDGLVALCDNIHDWKHVSGKLDPYCALNELAENLQFYDIGFIESVVIRVAAHKFNRVVLLLMKDVPHEFLK